MSPKPVLALALVLVVLVAAAAAVRKPALHELHTYSFAQYVKDFQKDYAPGSAEYARREALFAKQLGEVVAFNKQGRSWKKGVNHMSDWTEAEIRALNGNLPHGMVAHKLRGAQATFPRSGAPLPHSVDYRTSTPAVLTAVKTQGQCGSCWAHAAVEQIESMWAIATGRLHVLSQQQLVSCVANPLHCGGTGGCQGATAELAFEYVAQVGGITEEWMYGYESFFGQVPACAFNASRTKPVAKISGYTVLTRNDPAAVMEALATVGPLAISVDASPWHAYESGIFDGCDYSKNITMNHAVQLVGYGTDPALKADYWIVRNSWSPTWGENGYIRLHKESGAPRCGWSNDWVTIGGGCKGDPNTVWSCGTCGILFDLVYPNVQTA